MNIETLKENLSNCSLILHNALEKLALINYINKGYQFNDPIIASNHFLFLTANNLYKLVVLDLHALFGKANRTNKWSLLHFVVYRDLWPGKHSIDEVDDLLKDNTNNAVTVTRLRDKEIAHHDFDDKPSIKFNLNELDSLNDMANDAVKIIQLLAEAFNIEFDLETDNSSLEGLKELVNH